VVPPKNNQPERLGGAPQTKLNKSHMWPENKQRHSRCAKNYNKHDKRRPGVDFTKRRRPFPHPIQQQNIYTPTKHIHPPPMGKITVMLFIFLSSPEFIVTAMQQAPMPRDEQTGSDDPQATDGHDNIHKQGGKTEQHLQGWSLSPRVGTAS